jgi:LemA protein
MRMKRTMLNPLNFATRPRTPNTKIAQVPWNLFASMFNFTSREFFQVGDEAERAVPQVKFN